MHSRLKIGILSLCLATGLSQVTFAASYNQLMDKAQKNHDLTQKVRLLREAMELKPQESLPYILLAEIALKKGDLEEAEHQYTRALLIDNTQARAQKGLVRTYLSMARRANEARLTSQDATQLKEARSLQQTLQQLIGDTP